MPTPCSIAAIYLALAGLVVLLWLRADPLHVLAQAVDADTAPVGRRSDRLGRVVAELRVNGGPGCAVVAILIAQSVMVSIMTMTPVHIAHQGGSVTMVGITISLHIMGMYALSPIVELLADRSGPRNTISLAVLMFLALGIGVVRPNHPGWNIVSLILLLGVGWPIVNVAGSTLFSAVVSAQTGASSQGGVDALSNLCGADRGLCRRALLAASSIPALSILAMVVLMPLAVLTIVSRGSRIT